MKNRILKLKEMKSAVQHIKKAQQRYKVLSRYGSLTVTDGISVDENVIEFITKCLHTDIKKDDNRGYIFFEGLLLYSWDYWKKDRKTNSSRYNETKKMFKSAFFDTDGDREKAFSIIKEKDKYYLKNYNSLSELEKFWKRHENKKTNKDSILQEYTNYRSKWEKYDEDVRLRDYDHIRPMHDYWSPATLKQWCKHNL